MASWRKRAIGFAAVQIVKLAQFMLRGRSPEKVERFGQKLGRLLKKLGKKRWERCLANLEMAFPEMPQAERESLATRVYEHFGAMTADFIAGANRTPEQVDALTTVIGTQHLEDALKAGRGALLITGHIGHWERAATWLSNHGYKLTVVARDADQQRLNDIVNGMRRGPGTDVVARGNAARPILEKLKANEIVGILPDQNADEVFIPFFGKNAGTVLGPGVIHARTNATILPMVARVTGPGKVLVEFFPPLEPEPGHETKGEGMMRSINTWLEREIRKSPEQWLWFHDRWRNARRKGVL